MRRIWRYPAIVACAALVFLGLASAAPSLAGTQPGSCAATARTLNGTLTDGATYEIQVPANWNCTLFLYSHGYVVPGSANPAQDVGRPTRTIAWGHSLGGIITAGLIQDYPNRFSAALPMCGVLSGGVATWNTALDSEVAFQQLIDPSLQVVNITAPGTNLPAAEQAAATAQQTAQGRARLARAAGLGDTPGRFR